MQERKKNKKRKAAALGTLLLLGILCFAGCTGRQAGGKPTKKPEPTNTPAATDAPVPTDAMVTEKPPVATEPPVPTDAPTKALPPTKTPSVTAVLTDTPTGGLSATPSPAPTDTPVPTNATVTEKPPTATPVPVPSPVPTATPSPSVTAAPVGTPVLSPTKTPVITPTKEVQTPAPTETPKLPETPTPSEGGLTPTGTEEQPSPTGTPEPTGTATEISATPTPPPLVFPDPPEDFEALLRKGWQRTRDFFEEKEIYFPGDFVTANIIVEDGYYLCEYRKLQDTGTVFWMEGMEGMQPEAVLLQIQEKPGFVAQKEESSETGYYYRDGEMLVFGMLYACRDGNVMRIELQSPAEGGEEPLKEFFYVR